MATDGASEVASRPTTSWGRCGAPRTTRSGVTVVGRQGSPVDRPAHTAESYADAIDAGVDYVETEVVMTQDGSLLVRADNELSASTDVAERPEFADRRRPRRSTARSGTGWFTEDFTLDELRTLRAVRAPTPSCGPRARRTTASSR